MDNLCPGVGRYLGKEKVNKMDVNFKEYYHRLTGFNPYNYQEKVAEVLLANEKNIILSVPTGAGKTWASVMPFLYARQNGLHFPKKMIYSLPLRALTNSIYEDVRGVLLKNGYSEEDLKRQTGEFSEDKYFEKDILFSTIDQTLSSFLCFPLALSKRQANINAGALIGSYLVFDEFHLLDGERSMATTLGMLRMLGKLSRFCIMTATLSDEFMAEIQSALTNVEIITLDGFQEDIDKIGSLQVPAGKASKKEIEVAEGQINGKQIIKYHQNKSIAICNRVETAQRIYLELEDWAKEKNVTLICLHSRFFDSDRKVYEKQLKKLFGKDSSKDINAILIATQVIEAGMDISCEIMHTEIAPINALLQRVGRCARYASEYGKIFVYDVLSVEDKARIEEADFENLSKDDKAEIRKLQNFYLPYDKDLCRLTFEKLKTPENQQLNEEVTVRLVNELLTEMEQKMLQQLQTTKYNSDKIQHAWQDCLKSHYRHTIRDIQSTDVVFVSDKSFAKKYPYSLESINIFKWSLVKLVKEVLEIVDTEEDWVLGVVEESNLIGYDLDVEEAELSFQEIKDVEDVINTFSTLYLNPKYFHYDKSIGFNRERGNEYSKFKERKEKEKIVHAYRKDTFIQHTKGLLGAFEKEFLSSMSFVFKAFNRMLGAEIDFKKFVQLVLILHDYGKLDEKWQAWMQEYQKELSLLPNSIYTYEEGVPLGHTGFNSKEEKEEWGEVLEAITKETENKIFQKRGKRPSHSGVGAYVLPNTLETWLGEKLCDRLYKPASLAIARHHGVDNISYPAYNISNHDYKAIQQILDEYQFTDTVLEQKVRRKGELEPIELDNFDQYLLYLFLVRILRLCDQKATNDFEKYLSEYKNSEKHPLTET